MSNIGYIMVKRMAIPNHWLPGLKIGYGTLIQLAFQVSTTTLRPLSTELKRFKKTSRTITVIGWISALPWPRSSVKGAGSITIVSAASIPVFHPIVATSNMTLVYPEIAINTFYHPVKQAGTDYSGGGSILHVVRKDPVVPPMNEPAVSIAIPEDPGNGDLIFNTPQLPANI